MKKILIIDDEENIRRLIKYDLVNAGFICDEAEDGEEAYNKAINNQYDLLLVDWMLPKIEGVQLIKKLRAKHINCPMILLTAKSEECFVLEGFEAGADDYVTKPFSPRVLLARINANLRKTNTDDKKDSLSLGNVSIDENKREVFVDEKLIDLTNKEYDLLKYLIVNKNIVVSRNQILSELWGFDYDGDTRIVDVNMFKLRSKLSSANFQIQSKRGIGYMLEIEE